MINIYNSAGVNVTNNITAGDTLSYTVPAGQGGAYYARVSSASTTTVSFWMDWDGGNNEIPIAFSGQDLYLDNGYFGFNGVGGTVYGTSSAGLENSWHLVTAVFVDGNGTNDQLWIDGVQQALAATRGRSAGRRWPPPRRPSATTSTTATPSPASSTRSPTSTAPSPPPRSPPSTTPATAAAIAR